MPQKKKTIAIDSPLSEITLRKYEAPENLEDRELVRKLCLSLGLLQPGDSRDVVVDVLHVMLTNKGQLTSREIEDLVVQNRQKYSMAMLGIASSNIRRQLLRLRDLFILEKVRNNYRIRENARLQDIFEENIEKYYMNSIVGRVKDYVKRVDSHFFE